MSLIPRHLDSSLWIQIIDGELQKIFPESRTMESNERIRTGQRAIQAFSVVVRRRPEI
jgi:hypothetical protein